MVSGKASIVPAMEITTHMEQDTCIIDLRGDLDFGASLLLDETIKMTLLQGGPGLKKLYVNCKELQFISSAGIGVFVENIHLLHAHKVALVLYEMNHLVRDIFSIVGLDKYFPIVASKEEANALRCCRGY
jgi:anti-sigma B factor antagonist